MGHRTSLKDAGGVNNLSVKHYGEHVLGCNCIGKVGDLCRNTESERLLHFAFPVVSA